MNSLEACIIGTGRAAACHARILGDDPRVCLVSVCSRSYSTGQAFAMQHRVEPVVGIAQAVRRRAAVYVVCVPTAQHWEIMQELTAACPLSLVVVEKPAVANETELHHALEMEVQGRMANVVVAENQFYLPLFDQLRALGGERALHAQPRNIWLRHEMTGGSTDIGRAMWESGIHAIARLRRLVSLFGDPEPVLWSNLRIRSLTRSKRAIVVEGTFLRTVRIHLDVRLRRTRSSLPTRILHPTRVRVGSEVILTDGGRLAGRIGTSFTRASPRYNVYRGADPNGYRNMWNALLRSRDPEHSGGRPVYDLERGLDDLGLVAQCLDQSR